AVRRGDDPTVRTKLAWAFFRAGQVAEEVGDPAEGLRLFERSLEIRRELLAARPGDPELRLDLAYSHHKLGDMLGELRRPAQGLGPLERACSLLEDLGRSGLPPRAHCALSEASVCLGRLQFRLGQNPEAAGSYGRALAAYQAEVSDRPADDHARRGLAGVFNNLGNVHGRAGRAAEAEASYRRAIALYEPMVRDHSEDTKAREGLGTALTNLGRLLPVPARAGEAERSFRRA